MILDKDELIERFGVADESGELVVDRHALLKDIINRGVLLLRAIDSLKEDSKKIVAEADEYGFDKAEVKALIKYAHKDSIDSEVEALLELQVKLGDLLKAD